MGEFNIKGDEQLECFVDSVVKCGCLNAMEVYESKEEIKSLLKKLTRYSKGEIYGIHAKNPGRITAGLWGIELHKDVSDMYDECNLKWADLHLSGSEFTLDERIERVGLIIEEYITCLLKKIDKIDEIGFDCNEDTIENIKCACHELKNNQFYTSYIINRRQELISSINNIAKHIRSLEKYVI